MKNILEKLNKAVAAYNASAEKEWANEKIVTVWQLEEEGEGWLLNLSIGKFSQSYHNVYITDEGWSVRAESEPNELLDDVMTYIVMPVFNDK